MVKLYSMLSVYHPLTMALPFSGPQMGKQALLVQVSNLLRPHAHMDIYRSIRGAFNHITSIFRRLAFEKKKQGLCISGTRIWVH